jgi:hypothetical protein
MSSQEKQQVIVDINSNYNNHNDYKSYLELALEKHKFQNYSLKKNKQEIQQQDYIINDINTRNIISNTLETNKINKTTFNIILNKLAYEQMLYIGI